MMSLLANTCDDVAIAIMFIHNIVTSLRVAIVSVVQSWRVKDDIAVSTRDD